MIPDLEFLLALGRIGLWLASVGFGGMGVWMVAMAWMTSSPILLLHAGLSLAIAWAIIKSGEPLA